jgi:hypothetical protein
MDFLFDQILEEIASLNEIKQQHYRQIHDICLQAASCLIMNCAYTKKVDSFVNKMFKMADSYVTENNGVSPEKMTKVQITLTYEAYRKKKEAVVAQATMKASFLQVSSSA